MPPFYLFSLYIFFFSSQINIGPIRQIEKCVTTRGGHTQLFFESATTILQLEESTSAIAIPQLFTEMLLPNQNFAKKLCNSNFFLSLQLETFTVTIFGIILALE
jgi:hypothetical protein